MASKSDKAVIENLVISVRALVNIKYDKEIYKIGDELKVRKEDSQDMLEKEYVELVGE